MDSPIVHEGFGLDGTDENVDYEKVLVFIQENRLHQVGATANKARKKLEAEGKLKNLDEQKPSNKESDEMVKTEKSEDSEKSPDPLAGKSKTNKIGNLFKLYSRTIALTKKKDPPKKDDEKKLEADEKNADKSKETLSDPDKKIAPVKSPSNSPTQLQNDEKNKNAQEVNKPTETVTKLSPSQTPTLESQPTQPANEEGLEDSNKKALKLKTFGTIMRFFSKPPPAKVPSTETPPLIEGESPNDNPKLSDAVPPDENIKKLNNSELEIKSKNSESKIMTTNETINKSEDQSKDIPKEEKNAEVVKLEDSKMNNQGEQVEPENEQKDDKPSVIEDKYPMPKDYKESGKDKISEKNKVEKIPKNSKTMNDTKNTSYREVAKKSTSPEEKQIGISTESEKSENLMQKSEKVPEDKNIYKTLGEPKIVEKTDIFEGLKDIGVKGEKVESEYKQDKPQQPGTTKEPPKTDDNTDAAAKLEDKNSVNIEKDKEPKITKINEETEKLNGVRGQENIVKPEKKDKPQQPGIMAKQPPKTNDNTDTNSENIEKDKKPKITKGNEGTEKLNGMRDQENIVKPEKEKTQNKSDGSEKDKLREKLPKEEEKSEKSESREKPKDKTLENVTKYEKPKKSEDQETILKPEIEKTLNKSDDTEKDKSPENLKDLKTLEDQEKDNGLKTNKKPVNEISENVTKSEEAKKSDKIKHDSDIATDKLSKKKPEYNNKNLISKQSNNLEEPKENDKNETGIVDKSKATNDSEKSQELKIPEKINEADKNFSKSGNLEKEAKSIKPPDKKESKEGSVKPIPLRKASETGKIISEKAKDEKKSLDPDKKSGASESFKPKPPLIENLNKPAKSKEPTKVIYAESDKNKPLPVNNKRPSISRPNKQIDAKNPLENNSLTSTKKSVENKDKDNGTSPKHTINIPEQPYKKTFKSDDKFNESVEIFKESIREDDDKDKKDDLKNSLSGKVVEEEIITPSKKPIKEIVAIREVDDVLIIETEITTGEATKATNKDSVSTVKLYNDQEYVRKPNIIDKMETKSDIINRSFKKETPFEELEVDDDEDRWRNGDQVVPDGKKHAVSDAKKGKGEKVKIDKRPIKNDRNIKTNERKGSLINGQKKELFKPSKTDKTDKNLPIQAKIKNEKPDSEFQGPNGNELGSPTNGDRWKETSSDTSANDWYEARSDLSDLYPDNDEQVRNIEFEDNKINTNGNNIIQDSDKLGPSKIPIPIKYAPVKTLTCVGIQTDLPDSGSTKRPSSQGSLSKKPMRNINNIPQTLNTSAVNKSPATSRYEVNTNKPIKPLVKKRPPMKKVLNKPVDIGPIGFSNISNLKADKPDSKLQTKLGLGNEDFPRQSRTKLPTKIDDRTDKRMLGSEQLLQRKLTPDLKRKANLSSDILDSSPQSHLTLDQKMKANLSADPLDMKLGRTPSPEMNKRNNLSADILNPKRINYINSITTPFSLTQTNSQESKIPMKLPTRIKRPLSASPTRAHAMEPSKPSSKSSIRRSDDDLKDKDPTKFRDPCRNNICKSRRCTCLTQSAEDLMNFSNASSILKMTFVPPNKKPGWRI